MWTSEQLSTSTRTPDPSTQERFLQSVWLAAQHVPLYSYSAPFVKGPSHSAQQGKPTLAGLMSQPRAPQAPTFLLSAHQGLLPAVAKSLEVLQDLEGAIIGHVVATDLQDALACTEPSSHSLGAWGTGALEARARQRSHVQAAPANSCI